MEENNEINFLELVELLWAEKKKIIFSSLFLALLLFLYSIFLPDIFISESKLNVVKDDMSKQLEASNLGIFNVFQQNQSQRGFIEDHIESRDFFKRVSENTNIVILLLGIENIDGKDEQQIKNILYSQSIKEKYDQQISSLDFLNIHALFKSTFEVDNANGPFTIRSKHTNPVLTKVFIELLVNETNSYFKLKDDKESKDAIKFISEELPKNKVIDIQMTLSSVLSAKLRTLVLSNIKTDYILEYIDSPFIPSSPSLPSKRNYFLSGMILGFIFSVFWVLTRKYLIKN